MIESPRKKKIYMKDEDVFDLYKISRCVSSDLGSSTEEKKIIRFFFFLYSGSATEILALCSSR